MSQKKQRIFNNIDVNISKPINFGFWNFNIHTLAFLEILTPHGMLQLQVPSLDFPHETDL